MPAGFLQRAGQVFHWLRLQRRPVPAPVPAPGPSADGEWALRPSRSSLQGRGGTLAGRTLVCLAEQRDSASWQGFHAQELQRAALCQHRASLIEAEQIPNESDFKRRLDLWKQYFEAEAAAAKPPKLSKAHIEESASKWSAEVRGSLIAEDGVSLPRSGAAEVLGEYIPPLSVRAWGEPAAYGPTVPLGSLAQFLESPEPALLRGAARGSTCREIWKDRGLLSESPRLALEIARRIRESLTACGLADGSLLELGACPEATSRLVIDAVLVPVCNRAGLQMRLEERFNGPDVVSGVADYRLQRVRSSGGSDVVAILESKRCLAAKWPSTLVQGAVQALIQLVSIAGRGELSDCVRGSFDRLTLASDGRWWIALSLGDEDVGLLLWPSRDGKALAPVVDLSSEDG
eukprot:CAMPEP_0175793534 /NCGR_PEP_ID=MMETSP0097-20121207/83514_1 /TAXON_ID=311494 /ORGANISM="Alexandrium monilatum, Strain CCMP3105" /LENGTH=402 /DNA_ID=CAMNT_0017104721 /DNA_START=54 /DNA_END=1257 /DNA_ORIENTATION=+